jgi:hypothetical protein
MATSLAGFRSWFNSTVYYTIEELAKMEKDPIFDLFGEIDYNKNTGDTVNFTGRAFGGFAPIVSPGGTIPESNPVEGDQLAKTFLSVKDRMVVEWETILHDKLDYVKEDTAALVQRCVNTPALVMTNAFFTNANAGTVTLPGGQTYTTTCADGQFLADTDHTVPGASGSTFRNTTTGTDTLSEAGITNAIQLGNQNIVNDDGVVAPWDPDTLIVANNESMIRKALEITRSDKITNSANNTVQIYTGGRFKVVVLKHAPRNAIGSYSTTAGDMYRWAIADSRMLKRAIKYAWAAKPQNYVVGKFQSRENLDSTIAVAGRFVFGFPRWQGIVYSLATSAPTLG